MSKSVLQPFEDYQKARITFVQHIAELATRTQNIPALHSAGVMGLLRPLLLDSVNSIQQSAALAIGRLANHSEELAQSVIDNEIVPQLLYSLLNENRFFKKAACFVLRAVAKHSAKLCNDLVKVGALAPLVKCLEDFDPSVKESAAWALGYISKHNANLAHMVVETRAIDNLVLCLQEPEMDLKRASAQTLCYISSHTEYLAQPVAESGLEAITHYLNYDDTKLKKNICLLLANISKHTVELANMVINKINIQKLLLCLNQKEDPQVRKNAAMCVRELVHKNSNIANVIVNNKGVQVLVEYVATTKGESLMNGVLALGLIAAYKEEFAMLIIKSNGVLELKKALENENNQSIKSIICFTLGCIGGHSALHSSEVAKEKLLSTMLFYNMSYESNDELKNKSKDALKKIISISNVVEHLEPLLQVASENILKHLLFQVHKILKNSKEEMKSFMMSGGLSKIQELKGRVSEVMKLKIDEINSIYPPDVIKYFNPEYCNSLLEKIS